MVKLLPRKEPYIKYLIVERMERSMYPQKINEVRGVIVVKVLGLIYKLYISNHLENILESFLRLLK